MADLTQDQRDELAAAVADALEPILGVRLALGKRDRAADALAPLVASMVGVAEQRGYREALEREPGKLRVETAEELQPILDLFQADFERRMAEAYARGVAEQAAKVEAVLAEVDRSWGAAALLLGAKVRAALTFEGTDALTIPTPFVPFKGGDKVESYYLRTAARNIEGDYPVGGSNVTAMVVKTLRDVADQFDAAGGHSPEEQTPEPIPHRADRVEAGDDRG